MKRLFILAALVLPFLLAAKPASATLVLTPDPAMAWSVVNGEGCGYAPQVVYIDIEKPKALAFTGAMPDANGCITFQFTTDDPGVYLVSTRQQLHGRHWTVMASSELVVQ